MYNNITILYLQFLKINIYYDHDATLPKYLLDMSKVYLYFVTLWLSVDGVANHRAQYFNILKNIYAYVVTALCKEIGASTFS